MIDANPNLFSASSSKFIQEFCKPLQKVMLTNFMHDITYGNGQISMLTQHTEIAHFYAKNKIPMLCTDDSGRTLNAGIYINKILEESYKDCSLLMPLMVKIGNQFGLNYGKNSVHIVSKEEDCQHLYSLFFDLSENDFLHWTVNNGHFMQDLIANYNIVAEDVILEGKMRENRICLPNFSEIRPSCKKENQDTTRLCLFHKKMNIPINLSSQQSKCLLLLMKGKSAKEIALDMKLSSRTVEHYLEKIRKELGCSNNKELIAFYSKQLT